MHVSPCVITTWVQLYITIVTGSVTLFYVLKRFHEESVEHAMQLIHLRQWARGLKHDVVALYLLPAIRASDGTLRLWQPVWRRTR